MKAKEIKGFLKVISDASPSHLALISFILFPIALNYWTEAIINYFPDLNIAWKICSFVFLVILFLVCLIWLSIENQNKQKMESNKNRVMARLIANDWKSMSYDSARKVLGDDFSDNQFSQLISGFDSILRSVRIKDGEEKGKKKFKPGIGRYNFNE